MFVTKTVLVIRFPDLLWCHLLKLLL